jgi:hypothetical protein
VVNSPDTALEANPGGEAFRAFHREKLRETYLQRAAKLSHEELVEAYIQQGLEMRETHDELTWLAVELCWATDGSLWAARRQVTELVRLLRERAETAEAAVVQAQELLSAIKIPHSPFGASSSEASAVDKAAESKDEPVACEACGRYLFQAVEPGRTHLYHPAGFCSASKE